MAKFSQNYFEKKNEPYFVEILVLRPFSSPWRLHGVYRFPSQKVPDVCAVCTKDRHPQLSHVTMWLEILGTFHHHQSSLSWNEKNNELIVIPSLSSTFRTTPHCLVFVRLFVRQDKGGLYKQVFNAVARLRVIGQLSSPLFVIFPLGPDFDCLKSTPWLR